MVHKKGVPNPEIKKFEARLKQRGLLFHTARYWKSDITIEDTDGFISYAKRNNIKVIFKNKFYYKDVSFFYVVNGIIVRSKIFPEKVKPTWKPITSISV